MASLPVIHFNLKSFELGIPQIKLVKLKEKIFGITVSEGITEFLDWKGRQIDTKQIVPQRLQTIISHLAHFEKYLDGQFKVNDIPKTILRNNIINGVEKN